MMVAAPILLRRGELMNQSLGAPLPDPQLVLSCANTYCQMGLVPLATYVCVGHTPTGGAVCSCHKGQDCGNPGKHPIGTYGDIDTPEKGYVQVHNAVQQAVANNISVNLAVRAGPMSGIFVVDLDIKEEGKNGVTQFRRWLGQHGYTLEQMVYTLQAKSGGGGTHIFFKHPPDVALKPSNSGKEFGEGVDIKAGNAPVHVYPSIHKSGCSYEWTNWETPIDEAPPIIWQTAQKEERQFFDVVGAYTPSPTELTDFAEKLAATRGNDAKKEVGKNLRIVLSGEPIALDGGSHDAFRDIAFRLMGRWPTAEPQALCNFLIPAIQARLELRPSSNTTVESVLYALTSAQDKLKEKSLSWGGQLAVTEEGKPMATLANVLLFFRNHPAWQGVFGYDLRQNAPAYLRAPPYVANGINEHELVEMSRDRAEMALWFQTKAQMVGRIIKDDLSAAVMRAAKDFEFDPLYDRVIALRGQWDGVERLYSALQRVGGAPDTEWERTVFPVWMMSLVKRIIEPGSKVDTMLILEGPQGFQKSTFFSTLLPDMRYFSDSLAKVNQGIETLRLIHSGPAIFELSELGGLRRQEVEEIKAFLSSREDSLRPLWEPPRKAKRRCIIVGSTNLGEYLRDESGARRFWPVKILRIIDIDIVRAEAPQWFAEALHYLDQGMIHWLKGERIERLAREQQDERYEEDIIHRPVADWLNNPATPNSNPSTSTEQMQEMVNKQMSGCFVTTIQVAEHALGVELKNARTAEGPRINKILRREKWEPGRFKRFDKTRVRGWRRPGVEGWDENEAVLPPGTPSDTEEDTE